MFTLVPGRQVAHEIVETETNQALRPAQGSAPGWTARCVARYIRERRLLRAYARLRSDPDCTINFLLYDLGFESERQFQRAFQARFGMSPAQWRQACRANAGLVRPAASRRRPARWQAAYNG
ncbi:helix-turn-helix domain-containing protein [Luteimonas sp. SDU101]|uniref:helix-turn-helix domain-containing protein n=1 Tax=unclassified Luteimonas TaxID=2629088 RepID=UPI003EBE14DB